MTQMTVFWIIMMIALIVIEVCTINLTTVWFALGACAAAIASVIMPDSLLFQSVVFVAVSALLLPLTKPLAKKISRKAPPTNADRVLGEEAVVIETINNLAGSGQVKVLGQVWTARAKNPEATYNADEIVLVENIEGVKLIVKDIPQKKIGD